MNKLLLTCILTFLFSISSVFGAKISNRTDTNINLNFENGEAASLVLEGEADTEEPFTFTVTGTGTVIIEINGIIYVFETGSVVSVDPTSGTVILLSGRATVTSFSEDVTGLLQTPFGSASVTNGSGVVGVSSTDFTTAAVSGSVFATSAATGETVNVSVGSQTAMSETGQVVDAPSAVAPTTAPALAPSIIDGSSIIDDASDLEVSPS